MKLDAYLRDRRLTSAEFAKVTGVLTKQTVHNYRHGIRFPSPENLRLIREATGGMVTPDDFVEQHAGASEPATAAPKSKPKRSARSSAPETPTSAAEAA